MAGRTLHVIDFTTLLVATCHASDDEHLRAPNLSLVPKCMQSTHSLDDKFTRHTKSRHLHLVADSIHYLHGPCS